MSRIRLALTRAGRRVALAYRLACAREMAHLQGLRVPLGVWFCEHCRLVMWDGDSFVLHARRHAV